jgi:SAM-dependent methyltransferase
MVTDTKRYYETYWSPDGYNPLVTMSRDLRELLTTRVASTDRCLDVGCGDGSHYADWLNQNATAYVGVDISENAVRRARERGLDARLIDDAASLPFEDKSFDVVTCFEVFEHLFQPSAAALEIARVLRPGGVLLASVPNVAYWRWRLDLFLLGRWNPAGDSQSVARPWRDPHIRFFNRGRSVACLSWPDSSK